MSRLAAPVLAVFAALAVPGSAAALTPTVTAYSSGLNAGANAQGGIATGPDGNLWFADYGTPRAIGRITPTGTITEFGLAATTYPAEVAAGPDGNVWFTDCGTTPAIGQIDPSTHLVHEFSAGLNAGSCPNGIVAGPDGSLWFTDSGTTRAIGRIDPATDHIDEFSTGLNPGHYPREITVGPDGKLWFTDNASTTKAIGRIDPATHAVVEFSSGLGAGSQLAGIAAGPDGALWFPDSGTTKAIGRITPAGHITELTAGLGSDSSPYEIAAGPDGALWFGDESTPCCRVGRITTAGTIAEFPTSVQTGDYIARGPDGNMWFTAGHEIGRITTPPTAVTSSATATGPTTATVSGTAAGHAQATSFHVEYGPLGAATRSTAEQRLGTTTGATRLSATLTGLVPGTAYRVRVVVTNPTGSTAGAFLSLETPPSPTMPRRSAPRLSHVSQSHRRWREGTALPHIARARRPPIGTKFRFTVDQRVHLRLAFIQRLPGRTVEGRCVKPTKRSRHKPRCTRTVARGALSRRVIAGAHTVRFQGRIAKRKRLRAGRYTLIMTAANAAGDHATARLRFTIVSGR